MASIKVTPEELSSQGNDLISYAGELSDVLSSIDSKINEIIDGWDGLAQDAYYDMYSTMKESLDKFPEMVNSLGEATVSAAEAFESVDEQLQGGFNSAV
ncbi:MAG: WXG100 family type VII secretion target [Eubacterium sp.]|jgi:WXG100 family type VII secretion target|nr:WXG100 family type VII secretion target [Eubacterium sp.]